MATVYLSYNSKFYIPVAVGCCPDVYLCLGPDFAARTVDGTRFVLATITSGRFLGSGGWSFTPRFENLRCEDEYQYTICYEDDLLEIDPLTTQPFEITCEDILEINPYVCTINALLALVGP